MNQSFILSLALFLGAVFTLGAEEANRWTFFESLDWGARLVYVQEEPAVKSDAAFLLKALKLADSERIESGTDMEMSNKKAVAQIAMRFLADHPVDGAVAAIARIPRQYRDSVLRGEAWVALAKLGDKASVDGMIRSLALLNDSGARSRAEEIQAAYLIQALGILKAPEAHRTLWAASLAWYSPSSGVKAQARRAAAAVVADAEKATLDLLANDEDLSLREGIFLAIADQGDAAATARASAAVLSTLVRLQPRDKADQDRTIRLTLESLVSAQKAPSPPATLVAPLKILLVRADNTEATTQAVRLLGKIDDPSALALLTSTLSGYNAQQKARTNRPDDLAVVRELFQALAATGKTAARVALEEARFSDYTPAMAQSAQEALDKLPKE